MNAQLISVDRRERRRARQRRELAAFRHALRFFEPVEALRNTFGFQATWNAVRRVAAALIGTEVKDVFVAWQIVYFARDISGGKRRLKAATNCAVEQWALAAGETTTEKARA
ncbi:MAG: hypothetical protein U0990_12700 [Candidatus Nanopelagicales bacterium]|nr:hypothetical protein [Candidatus Nanopelagicales bacterium]